jgi:regulator of protease activity HflC (stomatin/prohibitin superfamily)
MVILWIVIGILAFFGLVVVLPTSIFTVQQQTAAVVERFGRFKRVAGPGIHTKAPLGIDRIVARPTLRIQQLDLKMESKTKDDVTVELQLAIQFVVPGPEKVFDAHYKLVEPSVQMDAWVFDVVRSKVPFMGLNEVYENKDEIAKEVEERLKERMHLYGFEIVRALVNDVIPPEKVKSAMNEVNTQQRLQSAAYAEGEKNKIIIVKKAEAEAESKRLQGEGIANQRKAIVKGYKESIQDFVKGIPVSTAREVMDMVVVTQYFDTLERLGGDARSKVVFLPSTPGAVGDFMNQIRVAFASGMEADVDESEFGAGETTAAPKQVKTVSRQR